MFRESNSKTLNMILISNFDSPRNALCEQDSFSFAHMIEILLQKQLVKMSKAGEMFRVRGALVEPI